MKKMILICALLCLCSSAYALDPYRDFDSHATSSSLKPFARDLGGLLGSGIFNKGRILGFSGFDVSIRTVMQFEPEADNQILRKTGVTNIWFPWIQASIGMPFRLDGFIRSSSFQGLTVAGGGLKWGIWQGSSEKPGYLRALLYIAAHSAVHEDFSATHLGGGMGVSWNFPYVAPFVGVGFDRTKLTVKNAPVGSGLEGESVTVTEPRATIGANVPIKRYEYFSLSGIWMHGQFGMSSSLGIRF
jgi:hypothetical protein